MVATAALLAYAGWMGRGTFFFSDDWDIIAFHHDGNELVPFNGHLSLIPVTVFRGLFLSVGIDQYWPYRLVGLVTYGALGVVLFAYARRRVHPVAAAAAALSVLAFSAADINVMFPFLINFSIPVGACVGMWLLLDRQTPAADVGASLLLGLALASSGIGLMAMVAAGVELALTRAPWRRWATFAPPAALWLAWYAAYRDEVAANPGPGPTLRYAWQEVEATFAAFVGGWLPGGWLLLAATVALFLVAALRWRTLDARAVGALAAFAAFTGLTAYTRIGIVPLIPPDTGRYLWVNGAFLVLAVVQVCRGRRLPWPAIAAAVALVALGAAQLVGALRDYRDGQLSYRRTITTYLVATEAVGDRADPDRILPLSFIVVRVDDYQAAVDHLGTPIPDADLDDLGAEADRQQADAWMVEDLAISLRPGLPPSGTCAPGTADDGGWVTLPPGAAATVAAGEAGAPVHLARLARTPGDLPLGDVAPGTTVHVAPPEDRSSLPWRIRAEGATVSICR